MGSMKDISTTVGAPRFRVGESRRWREPDPALAKRLTSYFDRLVDHAKATGGRVYFYTLSSRLPGWKGHEAVLEDIKGRWHLFTQSTLWRRLQAKVWSFGDHERPHVHLAVVLPQGITVHAVRDRWDAGFTFGEPVDLKRYHRLAVYFAAQADPAARKRRARHRYFGVCLPKCGA
jgi:hypothetical protein